MQRYKNISIPLTIALLIPIAKYLLHIWMYFRKGSAFRVFGFSNDFIFEATKPAIILCSIFIVAFAISVFLNVKKKYVANVIVAGIMMLAYFLQPLFIKIL